MMRYFNSESARYRPAGLLLIFIVLSTVLSAQTDSVRINEFMALNRTTIADEDSEYSDWIELYNASAEAVNLDGWSLTDEMEIMRKWVFPSMILAPGEYLLVFASGKNRTEAGHELHTNFRLEGSGEFLALIDPDENYMSLFSPGFPKQQTDFSYGLLGNDYVEFTLPTPGTENLEAGSLYPAPRMDKPHGLCVDPFELSISSGLQDAEIYYTLDGSVPDKTNGIPYTSPLQITTTTVVRAASFTQNGIPGRIATQTYIFPADVIHQPNDPEGYPAKWGPYTAIPDTAIGDYEMDPEMMSDPAFAERAISALYALPVVSLVSDKGNFFSRELDEETGGIYIYTGAPGDMRGWGWERPVSFEYFNPSDTLSIQVDCGVRLQGGHSRRPEKSPKHSFLLLFRGGYGASRLNFPIFRDEGATDSHDNLILRAGFGLSWVHHSHGERVKAQYQRDAWTKDAQRATGHPSSRSEYVHLYINGIYWGIYAPAERMDSEFAASYLGGKAEDYDVIKDYAEVADGSIDAWDKMMGMANEGLALDEAYQEIQGNNPDGTPNPDMESMVDVVNLADYMLVNFYGSNTDWDHHNWAAMRNRVDPGKGFKFFTWDAEHMLKTVNGNVLGENNNNCPSRVFQRLMENEQYRRLFADRIQKHCFGNGALSPGHAFDVWKTKMDVVEPAVDAEAARWGDYRRDVHQYQTAGPFDLYNKDTHWLVERDFMVNTYFPERTDVFLGQLRSAGLFPSVDAPVMLINDHPVEQKEINPGDVLTMTAGEGIIYYTLNGSDPAYWESDQSGNDLELVAADADKNALVPKSDIGSTWISDLEFDDSGWSHCQGSPGGIGYEAGTGYAGLISLDVIEEMRSGTNPNTSCYIRIPFSVSAADLEEIGFLDLRIRYDDGFIAYLNGDKIAEQNAPESPVWNSNSSGSHEAGSPESFNVSQAIGSLVEGDNLLAIQGFNFSLNSSDFLIYVELLGRNEESTGISEDALMYSGPLTLQESSRVRARTFYYGEWSAMNENCFVIREDYRDLKLTEINYHPLGQDTIDGRRFEFLELKNTGTSTLDLSGARFIDGVGYRFPDETVLGPKEFIVLTENRVHFIERYADLIKDVGFYPFDNYSGQLNNGGEWIRMADPYGDTLINIHYNLTSSWPQLPDGFGYTLVPVETDPQNDQNHSSYWRPSYRIGGSPGSDDLPLSVKPVETPSSGEIFLSRNYPNPFTDITHIFYSLPGESYVRLSVINMLGQEIRTLQDGPQPGGPHTVDWDGTDQNRNRVNPGLYFYRLIVRTGPSQVQHTRKMLLSR